MIWNPTPNPGDMALCKGCPHQREDARRDYRCAITRHHPYLPPNTQLLGGKTEYCGWWPPKEEPAEDQQLSLLQEAVAS